jgi:hypothetical protein
MDIRTHAEISAKYNKIKTRGLEILVYFCLTTCFLRADSKVLLGDSSVSNGG